MIKLTISCREADENVPMSNCVYVLARRLAAPAASSKTFFFFHLVANHNK